MTTFDDLRSWIGREQSSADIVTEDLARKFAATFDNDGGMPRIGDAAPGLIHFCLAQPLAPSAKLGADGHPNRGDFLPPVPLPRRMWAGGTLRFHRDLLVGERVTRRSRVADVVSKEGRSGTLCFIKVEHAIDVEGRSVIEEDQSLVFRAASEGTKPSQRTEVAAKGAHRQDVLPTPILLFRYSALTFNGHRIHYDRRYVTEVEGYPGLVVHGPLLATWLYRFATKIRGVNPQLFSFRGQSPLFDSEIITLHAGEEEGGGLSLWAAHRDGPVGMTAKAVWS
jgi:3-methylfumaryl-CoA hydratase